MKYFFPRRHPAIQILAMLVCALQASSCTVPAAMASAERQIAPESYGGIVANETVTSAGDDFYRFFASAWRERALSERYAISIHERPSARWGSTVWIEYAQRRVFQASLPPARSAIQALSNRAVEIAFARITDAEVERLLFRNADFGPDEI